MAEGENSGGSGFAPGAIIAFFGAMVFLFPGPCLAAGKVFMWKAVSGKSTVYLLGSVHMADPSFYPLDPAIEAAFAQSSALAVEVDVSSVDQTALQAMVMEKGLYQGGDSLDRHVSAATIRAVAGYMGDNDILMQLFTRLKPWAVYLTLEQIEMERMGLDAELGIDLHFLNKAKKDSRRVFELETMESQLELISGFSDDVQEGLIMMTIAETKKREESLNSVIFSWKSGNAPLMENLMFSSLKENPGLAPVFEKMFFKRNEEMTERILKISAEGETLFVVVGAGHLLGERGVPSLLGGKKFAVTQVSSGK